MSDTLETAISTSDPAGTLYSRIFTSRTRSWVYNAPTSQLDQFAGEPFFELDVWSDRWQPVILNMLVCRGAELLSNADGTQTLFLADTSWQTASCQHPTYPQLFTWQRSDEFYWAFDGAPHLADVFDQEITTWVDLDARGRLTRVEVRAGASRDGMLLQSWGLLQDELVPGDRVPAIAFDPTPPEALLRWRNVESTTAQPLLHDTITLTEALGLAQTPLFGLPPGGGASDTLTSTTTLSATAMFSVTLLSIETGAPGQEELPRWYIDGEPPFQSALRSGYALRLTYRVRSPESTRNLYIYEGLAETFGAYLRGTARWTSSTPITLTIDGRTIAGWQVTDRPSSTWALFEIDGTLIAVENPYDQSTPLIAALRRIASP
jgi:hypothetical protein